MQMKNNDKIKKRNRNPKEERKKEIANILDINYNVIKNMTI